MHFCFRICLSDSIHQLWLQARLLRITKGVEVVGMVMPSDPLYFDSGNMIAFGSSTEASSAFSSLTISHPEFRVALMSMILSVSFITSRNLFAHNNSPVQPSALHINQNGSISRRHSCTTCSPRQLHLLRQFPTTSALLKRYPSRRPYLKR